MASFSTCTSLASGGTGFCSSYLASPLVLVNSKQLSPSFRNRFQSNLAFSIADGRVWVQNTPVTLQVHCGGDQSRGEIPTPLITKEAWKKSVLESETPVLVEFYASWCGPCRMVDRVIGEIAEEYTGKLKCFVLNTDSDPLIAEHYEIKAVPVVLLFKKGEKHESIVGTMPKEFYIAAIDRVLQL